MALGVNDLSLNQKEACKAKCLCVHYVDEEDAKISNQISIEFIFKYLVKGDFTLIFSYRINI